MSDPIRDYLRRFTNAIGVSAQLAHLHALIHDLIIITTNTEARMSDIQNQLDTIASKIDTAVADLTSEIAAAKQANPDVDLSRLEASVQKLSDLDAANAAPADNAPVAEAPASDAPVSDTPAAPVDAPVADATPTDAPADGTVTVDGSPDAGITTSGANATPA